MKKLFGVLLLGGVAFAVFLVVKRQPGEPLPTMVEKMQKMMEEMPEDFPPVVMFNNVAATRENTERILKLLETSGVAEGADPDEA